MTIQLPPLVTATSLARLLQRDPRALRRTLGPPIDRLQLGNKVVNVWRTPVDLGATAALAAHRQGGMK